MRLRSVFFVLFVFSACAEQVVVRETQAACGDGKIGTDEECDDGNEIPNDGCTDGCIDGKEDGSKEGRSDGCIDG